MTYCEVLDKHVAALHSIACMLSDYRPSQASSFTSATTATLASNTAQTWANAAALIGNDFKQSGSWSSDAVKDSRISATVPIYSSVLTLTLPNSQTISPPLLNCRCRNSIAKARCAALVAAAFIQSRIAAALYSDAANGCSGFIQGDAAHNCSGFIQHGRRPCTASDREQHSGGE